MGKQYRHTQTGHLLRTLTAWPAFVLVFAGYSAGLGVPFASFAAILAGFSWFVSSLTVEVTPNELVWFFGPGIWRKRVARESIVSATPVRNKWHWGLGIHLTPRGWLYSVDGLDAVEITLKNGRTLRIGSDEPAVLVRSLQAR